MVCVFRTIRYGKTIKRRNNWDLLWKGHETGKRPRFHHGKLYIDGALYQAWDVWTIHNPLIRVSPILNIFIALLLSFILNCILLIFDTQKLDANADQELSNPDLNLQLLSDHGIHTVEEINKLWSRTVEPQYSAIHLNTRSLNQHFERMCNLLDSISWKFDFLKRYKSYRNKIASINKRYTVSGYYNDILTKWDDTKDMWDKINLLINKKRLSSHIEKLQVED